MHPGATAKTKDMVKMKFDDLSAEIKSLVLDKVVYNEHSDI